ncbi:MAG: Na+/H+ antiporter subunit G [Gammaproteobacteria bacterium]|nr:Na+/H+ antiporter subunit G [Gammaproteobacteria bacterium]
MPLWLDIIVAILIVLGASFALIGAIGLVKFKDFQKRLHAPTKTATLGLGGMLIASMIYFTYTQRSFSAAELLITLCIFLTAPVSAHLLIKSALKSEAEPDLNEPPLP